MFKKLIEILKAHPRKIVFTEGSDPRILEASARLLSGTFLTPILVGNPDEIRQAAEDAGFNIRGAIIIDPENYENMEAMVSRMVELRKGIIRCFFIQQNLFRPTTNVMLSEKNTIIF